MYLKVSFSNVRKNYKDYSIYFVTLVMAVALFYAFNSLGSQSAFASATSDATRNLANQLISIMSVLSKVIALVLAFLIIYANNFLLKRRKKELGIYMMLGMENKKISIIFVLEVLMIGLISFVFGILLGFVLSQGISMVALKMFMFDLSEFKFAFSLEAFKSTLIAFGMIFIVVMLFNIRVLNKVSLIDLMSASRKNEVNKSKGNNIIVSIFTMSLTMLATCLFLVYLKDGLMPSSEWFKLVILFGIIGTTGLIYSLYTVVLKVAQNKKSWYFARINVFTIRQVSSKVNTNYITITLVSFLLTITILITSLGMGIAFTINSNSKAASPFDLSIYQEMAIDVPADLTISNHLLENDININDYLSKNVEVVIYKSQLTYKDIIDDENLLWSIDSELIYDQVPVMSLSDYNNILVYQGQDTIDLNDNQVMLNCVYEGTIDRLKGFVSNHDSIDMNGNNFEVINEVKDTIYYLSMIGMNDQGTLIVSDDYIQGLTPYYTIFSGNLLHESKSDILDNKLLSLVDVNNNTFDYFTKTMMNVLYFGSVAMLAFICSYIGIIFLIISVAILALQQLTEVNDNCYRYKMLTNIGVERKSCVGSLLSQISVYFGTPLMIALLYSVILLPKILEKVSHSLRLNISTHVGLTGLLILLIYGSYYLITYFASKRIIMD